MRRWLFKIFAAFSLLLFVALAGLWVLSGRYAAVWEFGWDGRPSSVQTGPGRVVLSQGSGDEPTWDWDFFRMADGSSAGLARTLVRGMELPERDLSGEPISWSISLPLGWFALGAFVPAGVCMVWRVRKRQTQAAGLCSKCGYDLRASKDRCPECGMPIPAGVVREPMR